MALTSSLFVVNSNISEKEKCDPPSFENPLFHLFSKMLIMKVFYCLIENPAAILRSCETIGRVKIARGQKSVSPYFPPQLTLVVATQPNQPPPTKGAWLGAISSSRRQLLSKRACQSSQTILRVLFSTNPAKFRPVDAL